MRDEVQYKRQK